MLIRYKKDYKITAMGLLSFLFAKKDIGRIQKTIMEYEEYPNWHLYLWKQENNIIGVIGFRITDELTVIIQHISVNPSYRNNGIGKMMIEAIIKQYGGKYEIHPDEETQGFFNKYLRRKK